MPGGRPQGVASTQNGGTPNVIRRAWIEVPYRRDAQRRGTPTAGHGQPVAGPEAVDGSYRRLPARPRTPHR